MSHNTTPEAGRPHFSSEAEEQSLSKKTLREVSKAHDSSFREGAASSINEVRSSVSELRSKLSRIEEQSPETFVSTMSYARRWISQKAEKLALRLQDALLTMKVHKNLEVNSLRSFLQTMRSAITADEKELLSMKALHTLAEHKLKEVLSRAGEKYSEYLEQEKYRDLREAIQEYAVYFLHGTTVDRTVTAKHKFQNVNWKDKMLITLSAAPDISVESMQVGEKIRHWSPFGVVLGGGRIEYAFPEDGGTVINEKNRRVPGGYYRKNNSKDLPFTPFKKFLTEAISKGGSSSEMQNEFVISNSEIVGIYISMDRGEQSSLEDNFGNSVDPKEVFKFAEQEGLPCYGSKGGKLHILHLEGENLRLGAVVTPSDIAHAPVHRKNIEDVLPAEKLAA